MTRSGWTRPWLLWAALACAPLVAHGDEEPAGAGTEEGEEESATPRAAGHIHLVRPSETLASIAQQYYGDPRRESVLVTENGLTASGGGAIVVGMRLRIPYVTYHRVVEGETWHSLAERFYGSTRRAFMLVEANRGNSADPPHVGAELIVAYPLRHIVQQNETLMRIARAYYGEGRQHYQRLRRFNNLRGNRVTRGQVVLVPLTNLTLSAEGTRAVEASTGEAPPTGDVRELQAAITAELPRLAQHVRRGRYAEAIALGNRLLGSGDLTGNQVVTIQRELGEAYVAVGRTDLATQAFAAALALQPDLTLDTVRTSPTVMAAYRAAQAALEAAAEASEAAAADAGPIDDAVDAGVAP